jgi:hypothetical protein
MKKGELGETLHSWNDAIAVIVEVNCFSTPVDPPKLSCMTFVSIEIVVGEPCRLCAPSYSHRVRSR